MIPTVALSARKSDAQSEIRAHAINLQQSLIAALFM
jgi:hypothetical protein